MVHQLIVFFPKSQLFKMVQSEGFIDYIINYAIDPLKAMAEVYKKIEYLPKKLQNNDLFETATNEPFPT